MEHRATPIGQVSKEIIEFAVRKYVEATGEEPNVVIEQREELDRKCWVLTIELSCQSLMACSREREQRSNEVRLGPKLRREGG